MPEFKNLGAFLLFAALVLIIVDMGKILGGATKGSVPPIVTVLLTGGASTEKPPLAEVTGS